jgi:hypothetical protein
MDLRQFYYHEFELLCIHLLEAEGFELLIQSDRSRDIGVKYLLSTVKQRKWVVEIKHRWPSVLTNAYIRNSANQLANTCEFLNAQEALLIFSSEIPKSIHESIAGSDETSIGTL